MTRSIARKTASRAVERSAGRPRRFSQEQIVEAALEVMERDGVDSLSISALAAQLKVSHSVLYKYVGDIEALEALAIKHLADELPMPGPGTPQQIRTQIIEALLIVRQLLLKHPRVLNPPLGSPARAAFMESVVQWVQAMTPFAESADAAAIGHSVLVYTVAQSAESERIHGKEALAQLARTHDRRLPKPKPLVDVLEHLIDRLFPGLPKTARPR